jgi:uncharacterized protein (TIRG00374 family)
MLRIIKILVSTTLIGVLVWNLDWTEFVADLKSMDPFLATVAFILLWIQYPLSAVKWQKSLKLHGIDYPVLYLLRVHCIAFFFNNFLPTSIGGDAYRSYRTMDAAKRPAHAISAVIMERLIGLISLVLLGYVAAIILINRGSLLHQHLVTIAVVIGFIGIVGTWIFWKTGSHEKLWARLKRIRRLEPIIDSIRVINRNKSHFSGLLIQSIIYQASAIFTVSLIFASVDLPGKIIESGFTAAAAGVAGILPISINGIGVVESSFVVAALETGLPYQQALLVTISLRAFMFLASVIFGILYAFEPSAAKIRQNDIDRVDPGNI